jgi:inner membrane protein
MDPLTHITAGALQGQSLRGGVYTRWVVLYCILAAWIPDIDNVVGLANPELYLLHHRGITHSFFGAAIIALLLAGTFRLFLPAFLFWKGWVIAYLGLLSHIFLDLITSYGTQIFSPFSRIPHAMPSVFIIDPFYTAALAAFLVTTWLYKKRRRQLAVLGLCLLVLYPMLNQGIRMVLKSKLEDRLTREGLSYERVDISPDALTPVYWKAIVEIGSTYKVANLNLLHLDKATSFETFEKADIHLMRRLGEQASFFNTYAWFAVYPTMKEMERSKGRSILFNDLRFYSTVGFVRSLFRDREPPFSLTAVLDDNGKLTEYKYQRPGRTKFIQHME